MGGDGESHGPQAPQGALHLHCDQLGDTVIFFFNVDQRYSQSFFLHKEVPPHFRFFPPLRWARPFGLSLRGLHFTDVSGLAPAADHVDLFALGAILEALLPAHVQRQCGRHFLNSGFGLPWFRF